MINEKLSCWIQCTDDTINKKLQYIIGDIKGQWENEILELRNITSICFKLVSPGLPLDNYIVQ